MFFWLRRKRAEEEPQEKGVELEANSRSFYEIDAKTAEMRSASVPVEIDGTMMPVELGHSRESLMYR